MTRLLRRLARWYLFNSWTNTLTYGERVRLNHWGATGNPEHYDGIWVHKPN